MKTGFRTLGLLLTFFEVLQQPLLLDYTNITARLRKNVFILKLHINYGNTELGGFKDDFKLDVKAINGIDKKNIAMLKMYAAGKIPANFLEVMCCPGGCVNGPCSLKK